MGPFCVLRVYEPIPCDLLTVPIPCALCLLGQSHVPRAYWANPLCSANLNLGQAHMRCSNRQMTGALLQYQVLCSQGLIPFAL